MRRRKKIIFNKMDYFLGGILGLILLAWPLVIVYANAALSESNISVERMRRDVTRQEAINEGLIMQINELASLTNIQGVAREHGISYNNNNIIIIQ